METMERGYCPHCSSPARARSLPAVLDKFVGPNLSPALAKEKPLLAFAMTGQERKALAAKFATQTSVSLYGNYGDGHIEGVDARDLSRFPDGSFSGVFSILVFDYFVETEKALAECHRVTAPGGLFFGAVSASRIVDGEMEPKVSYMIEPRPDYFSYIPKGETLADIKVGRTTFVDLMKRVGFKAQHMCVPDNASGEKSEWFLGVKPA